MEKENKLLKSSAGEKDKMADLVEKNNALTEWRRQLVEKNQNLVRFRLHGTELAYLLLTQ